MKFQNKKCLDDTEIDTEIFIIPFDLTIAIKINLNALLTQVI
jgi:hypothetical protein